jgi:hypothetical protein
MNLFNSGIRPKIDEYMAKQRAEVRDYGNFWSASSAGYCQRKLIFERLGVPPVSKDSDERKYRVFESGKIFHSWVQGITKNAGLSIAQELELQDDELMVRGHIDDLVLMQKPDDGASMYEGYPHLILYDYKTQHSGAFTWQKGKPASYFHKMQVGTYMYMLRKEKAVGPTNNGISYPDLSEARILKISKDDLRLDENQILWSEELEEEVYKYWGTLNAHWIMYQQAGKLPPCSCADHEGGFMAKEKFNPYFHNGEPCSIELYNKFKKEKTV